MKFLQAIGLVLVGIIPLSCMSVGELRGDFRYDREIGSYWSLAEKAATIDQKSEYIDKFIAGLEGSGAIVGNNALIFKTPDNDLQQNLRAVKSLQGRLHEIRNMDVQSFAYQQAIQQITAQEQGEAHKVIGELYSGWFLNTGRWYLWDWIGGTFVVLSIAFAFLMGIFAADLVFEF